MPPRRSHTHTQPLRAARVRGAWLDMAAVAAATVLAFLPALRNGFVNFDDDRLVLHNPYLRLPLADQLAWIWSTTLLGHYQPLTWLSLSLDHAIGGLAPLAYHLDSLLWHTAAALLLYSVLVDLLQRSRASTLEDAPRIRWCAAAGALFWSVHPLRVESVAWVAERRDVISIVFLLLAFRAYLRAAEDGSTSRSLLRRQAVPCLWLLLSLLAKAWGMTFVVTLIAVDVYPLRRLPLDRSVITDSRYRSIWREKIPYALLGAAAGVVAWLAQHGQPDTMLSTVEWPWQARVLQAAYGLCFYVWKTIWPAHLAVLYARPDPRQGFPPVFYASLVIVAIAAALVAWSARKYPAIAMASLVYAATVAPVLGLAQSGPQLAADRYTYVASLPFSALLAGALYVWPRGRRQPASTAFAAACLAALAVVTWNATMVWHDSARLWRHALDAGQSSYTAHMDYGQAVRANGQIDEAIAHYRIALKLNPQAGNAWYNLANALKAKGQLDEAERAYRLAIEYLSWKVDAQVNLGNLYLSRGELAPAIAEYRAATASLAHVPPAEFTPEPFLYLGMALSDSGDHAAARDALAVAERYPATRARALAELARIAR